MNSILRRVNFSFFRQTIVRFASKDGKTRPLIVVGHQSPDTDAITAAFIYADFLRRSSIDAEPFRLGEPNNETKFVMKRSNAEMPKILTENLPDGTEVALVDHNESQQSIKNIKKLRVTRVIDHHKIGDLMSSEPIFLRFEPVGCSSTILWKLYRENQIQISEQIAQLMCSAILSDTLNFRSPTTTNDDRQAVKFLSSIGKITDLNKFANEMFEAKSDLTGFSAREILLLDFKIYKFNDEIWGIATGETCSVSKMLERKIELLDAMNNEKKEKKLKGILFSIVDIFNERNFTLVPTETEIELVKKVFKSKVENNLADLGARISRKKQIIPPIEKFFQSK